MLHSCFLILCGQGCLSQQTGEEISWPLSSSPFLPVHYILYSHRRQWPNIYLPMIVSLKISPYSLWPWSAIKWFEMTRLTTLYSCLSWTTLSPHISVKDYMAKKWIGKVNNNLLKCLSCSTPCKVFSCYRIRWEVSELSWRSHLTSPYTARLILGQE
jgi:hypothetical protein